MAHRPLRYPLHGRVGQRNAPTVLNALYKKTQLFYEFRLGDAVPEDHLVRKIDAALDLSRLRSELAPHYSSMGRPSMDPELMIRIFDAELAEPAIGEVHLHFAADQSLRADRKDISNHQIVSGAGSLGALLAHRRGARSCQRHHPGRARADPAVAAAGAANRIGIVSLCSFVEQCAAV